MDHSTVVALIVVAAVVGSALLAVTVVLFVKLVKLRTLVRDEQMPMRGKIAFWTAIVYSVFPVDLLPDPILIDDIGAIAAAIYYVNNLASKHLGRAANREPTTIEHDDYMTPR